jgi:hypothetical protein
MDEQAVLNRRRYIEQLRQMTPEQRLLMAFELTEQARASLKEGLRHRFPEASAEELHRRYLQHWTSCHNRRL